MAEDCSRDLGTYPGMPGDFLLRPTAAQLTNIDLPNNQDLPNPVPDNQLYPVPANEEYTVGANHSLLTWSVEDGNNAPLPERQVIAAAYTRVTGHALPDDPAASFDIGNNPSGDLGSDYKYIMYAEIHNGLISWRGEEMIGGGNLYQIARRLVTYATDKHPTFGLGPLAGGKWWLAPDPYHIVAVFGFDPTKSGGPDHGRGSPLEFGNAMLNPGAVPSFGLDRPGDEQRFNNTLFIVHWVCIASVNYTKDSKNKTGYKANWGKDDHWAVIIRHKKTRRGFYFDSLMKGIEEDRKPARLQGVLTAMNHWLQRCGKPTLRGLTTVLTPVQKAGNSCGIHTIASVVAFICHGQIGWDQVPAWKPKTTAKTNGAIAEKNMIKEMSDSVHRLMGLQFCNGNEIKTNEAKARTFTAATMNTVLSTLGAAPPQPPNPPKPPKPPKPPNPPKPPKPPTEIDTDHSGSEPDKDMKKERAELGQLREQLEAREQALAARETAIATRETTLSARETAVAEREARANAKMERYKKKKEKLKDKALEGMVEKVEAAKARSDELKEKEKTVAEWEARLQALEDKNADPRPTGGADDQDNDTTLVDQDDEDDDEDDEEMTRYEDIWYTMGIPPGMHEDPEPAHESEDLQESPNEETGGGNAKYTAKGPGVSKSVSGDTDEPEDSTNKDAGPTTGTKSFAMAALKRKLDDLADKTDRDTKKRKKDLIDREAELNAAVTHRVAQEQRLKELQKREKFLEQQQQAEENE